MDVVNLGTVYVTQQKGTQDSHVKTVNRQPDNYISRTTHLLPLLLQLRLSEEDNLGTVYVSSPV